METNAPRTITATLSDGVTLFGDEWGPSGDATPILCLPGLTRNARDFTSLAGALHRAFRGTKRIIAMESRGRGRSSWAAGATYTPPQEVADLLEAMAVWGIVKAHLVGTSRGGLLAMGMAVGAPDRLGRVVLNDIGPIIDAQGLTRITASVGKTMTYPSFKALAAVQKERLGASFTTMDDAEWLRFVKQLASPQGEGDGGAVTLDYDPAIAESFSDAPVGELPDLWPAFDALASGRPVLVIRGVNSDLLSAATMEAMVRRDGVTGLTVADEGHAPLLWDRRTHDAIAEFFRAD